VRDQIIPIMKRKHHISHSSYQMLLDYLAKFLILDDENYYHHLEKSLIGWSCGGRDEEMHKAGTVLKKSWFITKGMVYLYFIDKNKGEVVFMLFRAGTIAYLPDSFTNGNPSSCYIMACGETELLEISKGDLDFIHQTIPKSLELENAIIATISEKARERDTLFWLEPEERILTFFELYPELHPYNRTVKMLDKNIANYLHIDQARFCRLKNKLYPKKSR
jgi:CRP-like cAMP-binding protein